MRVAVIGCGVAGLVTAKVLKSDGFDVTVFEKDSEIGGVWSSSRAYPGLRTNNPAPTYAFSDLDHPETTDEFPTAAQVREYLERFADHFDIRTDIELGTEMLSVVRCNGLGEASQPSFRLKTRAVGEGGVSGQREFDRVVVCNGVLCEPHLPRFEGDEHFGGSIVHSSQVPGENALAGRRVVVVGAGKSALDCAAAASEVAGACTLVFRRPYWMLPRYLRGRRVDRAAFNRVTEMLTFPAYHARPKTEAVLRYIGLPLLPLRWLIRRLQCRLVARGSGIPEFMVPDAPLHRHIYHQGIGTAFYEAFHRGEVDARRAAIERFEGTDGVRLDTGEVIGADVVICAAGWRQHLDFLEPGLLQAIRPRSRFRLYRHILPPAECGLGFVGYASSGNSPLTSEIAAHWLSQYFRGELSLPDKQAMEQSIDRVLDWTASVFPDQDQGHFIGAHVGGYIDWLMRDMGLATRRAGSLAEEYLGPIHARRYRNLDEERRRARKARI